MRSAIYEGRVTHRRHAAPSTGHVAHAFDQRVTMAYLFLDELDEFVARHPFWSIERANAVTFRRADYLGDASTPLEQSVRDAVQQRLGRRPSGPVAMLAHLRTWGWLFNPLTLYYCFDPSGERVDAIVLEVTSTPWHERHVYVIDGSLERPRFEKEMHVSPFLGLDLDYVMSWSVPGERLVVTLGNRHGDEKVFDASLALHRRGASRGDLSSMVWRRPLQTYGVSANIYRQAWRLMRKGAPFHPRARELAKRRTRDPLRAARE